MFQKEDYLNEKYLRKRSIYLSCLASKLLEAVKEDLIDADVNYILKNNIDKPILQLKHKDEKLSKYSIFVHVIPEKDIFPASRFVPTSNNVRYGWYFDMTGDGEYCATIWGFKENHINKKSVFNFIRKIKFTYSILQFDYSAWFNHQRKWRT